jgi:hypothetical protein
VRKTSSSSFLFCWCVFTFFAALQDASAVHDDFDDDDDDVCFLFLRVCVFGYVVSRQVRFKSVWLPVLQLVLHLIPCAQFFFLFSFYVFTFFAALQGSW